MANNNSFTQKLGEFFQKLLAFLTDDAINFVRDVLVLYQQVSADNQLNEDDIDEVVVFIYFKLSDKYHFFGDNPIEVKETIEAVVSGFKRVIELFKKLKIKTR